jgi:hypothetical protein
MSTTAGLIIAKNKAPLFLRVWILSSFLLCTEKRDDDVESRLLNRRRESLPNDDEVVLVKVFVKEDERRRIATLSFSLSLSGIILRVVVVE